MDYLSVLDYLRIVEQRGIRFGLRNTKTIIRRLPIDLKGIRFIQVAGTNGKGSTSWVLASILQISGTTGTGRSRVGLFTSPHLHDVRERITVNGTWIPESDFAAAITAIKETAEVLLKDGKVTGMPTYFEYTFLAALYHFFKEQVTTAVLEVGLGGRLDATSAVTPDVSVITGISHDHTGILGTRIKEIAFEKAGIIKKGAPVVCGCNVHSIANSTIKKRALELNAPFYNVFDSRNRLEILDPENKDGESNPAGGYRCSYYTPSGHYTFDVHLNGRHQARNAAIAVKVVQLLNSRGFNIPDAAINKGIETVRIPARIEIMKTTPPVILDGSHNPESIRALRDFLLEKKKKQLTLIFGVLNDKNYRPMLRMLLPHVEQVILTEPLSERSLPSDKLLPLFKSKGEKVHIIKKLRDALDSAQQKQKEILVAGSFYLVGEMRHIIINGG